MTHDALTNTVTIKQDIHNTTTHSTMTVFNRSHVEIEVVPGAAAVDDSVALTKIRYVGGGGDIANLWKRPLDPE